MRIIGGKFRGRRFDPPADNWPTRPTTDFSKEALFNILENEFEFSELKVLDLFCGTGSHTYEFISRGCEDVTCVDKFQPCISFVHKMTNYLNIQKNVNIVRADVFKFIQACDQTFDYIFAGPPYTLDTMDTLPDLIFEYNLLKENGLFVLEHNPKHNYTQHKYFLKCRNYGQTHFSFFTRPSAE